MNNLEINFRDPAADRFFQICAVAETIMVSELKVHVSNMPNGYKTTFLDKFLPNFQFCSFEECNFCFEFAPHVNWHTLFSQPRLESMEDITSKVVDVQYGSKSLSQSAMALLKVTIERLDMQKDLIQAVINLAYCISILNDVDLPSNNAFVEADAMGEAIQYCKKAIL